MNRIATRLAVLLSLALSSACGGKPAGEKPAPAAASGPIGKWALDSAAAYDLAKKASDDEIAKLGAGLRKEAQTRAAPELEAKKKLAAEMTLSEGGKFELRGKAPDGRETHETGTWKADGNQITITAKADGNDKEATLVGPLAGDMLNLEVTEGSKKIQLPFRRSK